ncbi:MAG: 1-acyl-sn-glycerol-3-phosphate acyltransferase [Leptospiraceae bacterium]|nr:1-acyl-sn-glycerol-3-phosphate acyltransferase [Leptospiraceae bacterium]MCP5499036.1 1-acyl-sn-glycerol-3-phosphate acyltransferase [Leptospiraceae bacterium]
MKPFIPANQNLLLNWTAELLFPTLLKSMHNINEIVISEEDKKLLRNHKDERVLLFTNHPTTAEPPIVFQLSNIMGSRFKYMASRQVFDWGFGLVGQVISNIGAFSVIAGIADRDSMKASRQALADKGGKLVLFPEGEPTSGENDNLMPFQSGLAQLSFWALEDARKIEKGADINILPAFIKYVVDATEKEILRDLDESISRIERKYSIKHWDKNILRRFLTVGRYLLEDAEHEYKILAPRQHDFNYRIGRVRHAILDNIADRLNMKNYKKDEDAIHKLRQIFALIEMISINYPDPKLPKINSQELEWAKREAIKAFDMIVIKRDYLISYPSPERFYEWLARYESYVFGKTPRAIGGEASHLPRKAYIKFANHFKLSEYYPQYKENRKQAMETMLERLRVDIQSLLDEMMQLTRPIIAPYDVGDDMIE